jgi:hypothetical protein
MAWVLLVKLITTEVILNEIFIIFSYSLFSFSSHSGPRADGDENE